MKHKIPKDVKILGLFVLYVILFVVIPNTEIGKAFLENIRIDTLVIKGSTPIEFFININNVHIIILALLAAIVLLGFVDITGDEHLMSVVDIVTLFISFSLQGFGYLPLMFIIVYRVKVLLYKLNMDRLKKHGKIKQVD